MILIADTTYRSRINLLSITILTKFFLLGNGLATIIMEKV